MQLLTAAKLSTVAMLVMAAVLVHSPVSGVPMEWDDVEDVEDVVMAPVDPYNSTEDRKPSQQAVNDLRAIYTLEEPQAKDGDPSPVPDDAQSPLDMLPDEKLVEIVDRMDWNSRKNFAQTSQRNYGIVQYRLPDFVDALVTGLDERWDAYKEENPTIGLDKWKRQYLCSAMPVWEKVVEEATDQKPIECSYNLLPYTPDERPEGPIPSEKKLFELASRDSNVFKAYVRHNVCRLAVNGAYQWLLRMVAMNEHHSITEIFSVLGQLRMFTSDRAFASDLDKVLKLFAKVKMTDNQWTSIPNDLRPLLMISSPEIIPAVVQSRDDVLKATLLLLAANQHQSKPASHMKVGGKSLADIAKMGNMDEFPRNIKQHLYVWGMYHMYADGLVDQLVKFNVLFGKTLRQAIIALRDDPSNIFESDGKIIKPSKVYNEIMYDLKSFEVLVRLLPENHLKAFYDDALRPERSLAYIIMGGRDTDKSKFMKHVFEDIFGGEGTPIPGDLEIARMRVDARDLAYLAQGCAIACTDENWKVLAEMYVKKIQSTSQLPGNVSNEPSSATPGQQVAVQIILQIKEIESKNETARKITPADKNPEIQAQVNTVIAKLQLLAATLSAPPAKSQLKRKGSPKEDEPAFKKTKH